MTMLAVIVGALIGLAICGIASVYARPVPDLQDAANRLQPSTHGKVTGVGSAGHSSWHRVGAWLQKTPLGHYVANPKNDLAITGQSYQRWLGEKVIFGVVGLVTVPFLYLVLVMVGISWPLYIPAAASVILGALFFVIPDLELRKKAKASREDFNRALCAYIDLVALERRAGVGATEALKHAAAVGDGPMFQRLREELTRAQFHGHSSWTALERLAIELDLPDLEDVAGIIRTTSSGAGVYDALNARSYSLRNAILNKDLERANQASQRLAMPTAAMSMVFLGLLLTPALMGMFR